MKMLDLNSYGVVEMTQQEMLEVEGGTWVGDALIIAGEFLVEVGEAINKFCSKIGKLFRRR
jgi:hypothetical protein